MDADAVVDVSAAKDRSSELNEQLLEFFCHTSVRLCLQQSARRIQRWFLFLNFMRSGARGDEGNGSAGVRTRAMWQTGNRTEPAIVSVSASGGEPSEYRHGQEEDHPLHGYKLSNRTRHRSLLRDDVIHTVRYVAQVHARGDVPRQKRDDDSPLSLFNDDDNEDSSGGLEVNYLSAPSRSLPHGNGERLDGDWGVEPQGRRRQEGGISGSDWVEEDYGAIEVGDSMLSSGSIRRNIHDRLTEHKPLHRPSAPRSAPSRVSHRRFTPAVTSNGLRDFSPEAPPSVRRSLPLASPGAVPTRDHHERFPHSVVQSWRADVEASAASATTKNQNMISYRTERLSWTSTPLVPSPALSPSPRPQDPANPSPTRNRLWEPWQDLEFHGPWGMAFENAAVIERLWDDPKELLQWEIQQLENRIRRHHEEWSLLRMVKRKCKREVEKHVMEVRETGETCVFFDNAGEVTAAKLGKAYKKVRCANG